MKIYKLIAELKVFPIFEDIIINIEDKRTGKFIPSKIVNVEYSGGDNFEVQINTILKPERFQDVEDLTGEQLVKNYNLFKREMEVRNLIPSNKNLKQKLESKSINFSCGHYIDDEFISLDDVKEILKKEGLF